MFIVKLLAVIIVIIVLVGCDKKTPANDIKKAVSASNTPKDVLSQSIEIEKQKTSSEKTFDTIGWDALIPEEDLEALLNPPEYIVQVVDGSMEDQIGSALESTMNADSQIDEVYEQALISTAIIESMNGKNIRIPGFVVPVEFTKEQKISSFFLVPYFGACIHMPPPPPNQIIYIKSEQGIVLEDLYDAVWVSGQLSAELFEDQIATSAYTMKLDSLALYDLDE